MSNNLYVGKVFNQKFAAFFANLLYLLTLHTRKNADKQTTFPFEVVEYWAYQRAKWGSKALDCCIFSLLCFVREKLFFLVKFLPPIPSQLQFWRNSHWRLIDNTLFTLLMYADFEEGTRDCDPQEAARALGNGREPPPRLLLIDFMSR